MGARRCPDYAVHVIQMNAIVASHVLDAFTHKTIAHNTLFLK